MGEGKKEPGFFAICVDSVSFPASTNKPRAVREFLKCRKYVVEHLEDMPAIRNWKWTPD